MKELAKNIDQICHDRKKERIGCFYDSIEHLKQRIEDPTDPIYKDAEKYKSLIASLNRALVWQYFLNPYFDAFLRWANVGDNYLQPEEVAELNNYIDMDYDSEAVGSFVNSLLSEKTEQEEIINKYLSDPSKAEQPIPEDIKNAFLEFLNKIFKPALLDLLADIRANKFRSRDEIINEQNALLVESAQAFDRGEEGPHSLTPPDTYLSRTTFRKHMQEQAKKAGFKKILRGIKKTVKESPDGSYFSWDNQYLVMYNNPGLNKFIRTNTAHIPMKVDELAHKATIENGDLQIFVENYNKATFSLKPSTGKLLEACIIKLTSTPNSLDIVIPLKEYLTLCGKKTTPSAVKDSYKAAKADLDTLYHISIEWNENRRTSTRNFIKMRICERAEMKNGNIIFSFSRSFAKALISSYQMQYPVALFTIDNYNPNAWYLGHKLSEHYSIDHNAETGSNDIISVAKLLESCPTLPTYEEVMQKDKHVSSRIIDPFEKALDHLKEKNVIKSWHYCNQKHTPLKKNQLKNWDYSVFKDLYITFEVYDVPDQTERRQKNKEAREAAQAAKEKEKTQKRKKTEKSDGAST